MTVINKEEIYDLVFNWGKFNISSQFSHKDMTKDMSLLGLDSIELVEICEILETKTSSAIELDWLLSCETLLTLVEKLSERLSSQELSTIA